MHAGANMVVPISEDGGSHLDYLTNSPFRRITTTVNYRLNSLNDYPFLSVHVNS
jgi:hypothetical protein